MRGLRKRHGRSRYGLPSYRRAGDVDLRRSYSAILAALYNSPGETRAQWRDWMARRGVPKQVTTHALSLAERRGHVRVEAGRYYLTPRGLEAIS